MSAHDRRALTKYRHIATPCRADDVTSMHHIRFFRSYVMASTTDWDWLPYFGSRWGMERGLAMLAEKQDLAPLLALLKMAAEQWPSSEVGEVSQSELLRRDQALLKMWPEACRRVGVEQREFPRGVIKRWQQEMSRGRPN
jgi:hypothetical protein